MPFGSGRAHRGSLLPTNVPAPERMRLGAIRIGELPASRGARVSWRMGAAPNSAAELIVRFRAISKIGPSRDRSGIVGATPHVLCSDLGGGCLLRLVCGVALPQQQCHADAGEYGTA